ncbi:hypothetical protein SLEP1_g49397 [Rubroshorea leprosula]|uniref:Transposase (putative) gypsy type domain-containing protein n=1 Tax=Rubroshorea leprosula TaxID=152421 RepID=A0AAV5LWP1_9ROSI|nr:hypothetical protein SLEP1_g49397 [Rubroshorea leprosula]
MTMIVPPVLQDLLETRMPESSASSSARDNGGDHHTSSSSSSSFKETPSREEWTGNVVSNVSDLPVIGEWESRTITSRLSNLRKVPKDLPAGFRFKAALHHEVIDSVPSISGYRKLEEMTGWMPMYVDHFDAGLRFPLPELIFDLLADYELALTRLTPNSIRFIIGFMLLYAWLEIPAKAIVFRSLFQCRLYPNSRGTKWYYLSGREKSQLFKNVRNKVARWKRQFIFVPAALGHGYKESAARIREKGKFDRSRGLGYLRVARCVRVCQCGKPIHRIISEPRAHEVAEWAAPCKDRRDLTSDHLQRLNHAARHIEDPARHLGHGSSTKLKLWPPVHAGESDYNGVLIKRAIYHGPGSNGARACVDLSVGGSIAYPDGFSYLHGGQVAMIKLMDAFSYAVALFESEQGARSQNNELSANCKQLAVEKASLVDDVNRL